MVSPALRHGMLFLPLLVPVMASSAWASARVTPVQKAVEMLQGMLGRAKQAKHEENVQYAGYKQFCDDVTVEKQKAVKEADDRIETLDAHVLKYDTEADRLGTEIVRHGADVAGWTNDTEAAHVVREREREDYMAMHRNYSESIEALTQAIATLKQQAYDRPSAQSALLLQRAKAVAFKVAPALARGSPMEAFIEQEPEAYEFRSHDILSMLEGLKDKFRDKLRELEREEVSRRHAFETLVQDLKQSIKAGENDAAQKTKSQLKNRQLSVDTAADLKDWRATRADDAAYLAQLTTTCQQKTADYESRQQLRGEEIDAITKAIDILSGEKVAGAAAQHLDKAFVTSPPRGNGTVLAQLRRVATASVAHGEPGQAAAAEMLRNVADRIGSHALSVLATHARDDPFAKVKTLIEELLHRLLAEAGEEAEHKGWCDTELGTNEHTRTTKTREVELLSTEVDKFQTDIASLAKDIAELSAMVAQLNADIAKETELRKQEKARNELTLQDARDAQTAMTDAISILKAFYEKAAQATAFVQQAPPAIFGADAYQGLGDESKGVLGMMEVIQSDFARLESDTATSEAASEAAYESFMDAAAIDKAQKEKDIEHKKSTKQSKEMDLLTAQSDLENAGKELDAAKATFERLKPACLDTGMTFEERTARRQEEIEALKEALRILSGEDPSAVYSGVLVKSPGGQGPLRSATTGLEYQP